MNPGDGGQDDAGGDEDERDLATLANLVHGDPDQDAIERESPRAADDDNFGWLEGNDGDIVVYDERNPWAWVSADDADDLNERK